MEPHANDVGSLKQADGLPLALSDYASRYLQQLGVLRAQLMDYHSYLYTLEGFDDLMERLADKHGRMIGSMIKDLQSIAFKGRGMRCAETHHRVYEMEAERPWDEVEQSDQGLWNEIEQSNHQRSWDEMEQSAKKSSHIETQRSQARTAQPGMMQALETRLITSAEANDPTWLAPVGSWLQAMGNLQTMQVTCDSQVKPASTHNKDKQAEAILGEPPPPSETPAGMSLPNQALMALFNQQAFFELCPLDTVASLASTGTMTQEPAVAAHLIVRTAFPRQLNGIPLHPESRWGQKYCADFQAGTCQEEDPCRSGAHRCAALFKSGRICHGKHAGSKCCCTRKHASLADLGNRG